MELYCAVGGQMDSLNRWQQDLNAQFLPVYDKDGKHKIVDGLPQYRRLLVAPIQLFKVCFAKEELNNVLAMVAPGDYITKRYSVLDKGIKFVKRILGLKSIPEVKHYNPFLQPNQVDKAVFVIPIGLKEDARNNLGEELI